MEATTLLQEERESNTPMRTVAGIVNSIETLEGGGFLVRRPFPKPTFSHFDPFLLLDEMGPMTVEPGKAKGAPDHPHRPAQRHEFGIALDVGHEVEHVGGGMLDAALGGELRHQRRASRAARRRRKSSPAWCDERVSGLAETIEKPLA